MAKSAKAEMENGSVNERPVVGVEKDRIELS